jgi:hypothetical protein
MNTFGICFQLRNEHFKPRMLFSVGTALWTLCDIGNGAMNASHNVFQHNIILVMLKVLSSETDPAEIKFIR